MHPHTLTRTLTLTHTHTHSHTRIVSQRYGSTLSYIVLNILSYIFVCLYFHQVQHEAAVIHILPLASEHCTVHIPALLLPCLRVTVTDLKKS